MHIEVKPRYIAFDAVEIDLVGRRVHVAGVETALEPKAFDVLALLAQTPGKAFARDEILDAVWGHRHVTPGVLNRAVTLIRQALGDGARALHTVHGIGYRFDGDIRLSAGRPSRNDASAAVTGAAPIADAASSATPATLSPAASAAAHAETRAPSSATTKARATLRWGLAAAVIALAVIGGAFYVPRAPAAPTLVVLPLHAIGDEKNENDFASGLSEELTMQLARVEGLHLISSTSAARARKEGLGPVQLAQRLHVTHALEGSLREADGKLRIDLRLIETPSGRMLWSEDYDRQAKDIFAVQQEIAQAVASALALRMKLERSSSPAPDPEQFREYLELRHTFNARPGGKEYRESEIALNALAARAPGFAAVHGLLALNLASHFEPGREQAALPEAMQALRTDPDSTYAHAALGELACMRFEWNDCMKELRTALGLNPTDTVMNLLVGMRLARLGYGKDALERFKIAYAIDPLSYWTNANLGTELDVLGRHEEARPYLDALTALDEEPNPWTAELRWRNAVWRNDPHAARDIAAHMADDFAWKASYVAFSAALENPMAWPDAMTKLSAARERTGRPDWLLLHALKPDADEVVRLYTESANENHFASKFMWTREYAGIRRTPAFSDFLRHTKTIDYWNAHGWPPQCKPDGDGARCD